MIDIVMLARGYVFDDVHRTHYEGCESEHVSCLMRKLADEIERLHADNQAAVAAYAAEITEAKAESERLRADRDHWHEARRNAIEAGDELLREIERLRADAERYRWLRDHGVTYVICRYEKGEDVEHDWCGWLPLDTRETDAAIDAAIAKWSERE